MRLNHDVHLGYCTNVHPAETWAETLAALQRWTLPIQEQFGRRGPFGIGLRLSDRAARELADTKQLEEFRRWLDHHRCYVFTINGFPFGQFHGGGVKEAVYRPDWSEAARLEYTNLLFDLLAELMPADIEGSVSTLPGAFKECITTPEQEQAMRANLWRCVEHIAALSRRTGRRLHLGLEPEPLCLWENSTEVIALFRQLRAEHADDPRLREHLGVNYDTCHFAIEFEEPAEAVRRFQAEGIRLSKIHVSNALQLRPGPAALARLAEFAEPTYLHQVIVRQPDQALIRFKDLPEALNSSMASVLSPNAEWRVHFHVPLHWVPEQELGTTAGHVQDLLDLLQAQPGLCSHLEMETYTWSVLPAPLKTRQLTEQITGEYHWMLGQLASRGLAPAVA